MSVETTVPTNLLEPNTFQTFDVISGSRGLVQLQQRIALVGQMADFAPADANIPVQVFTAADSDAACGQSSELAIMARAAFKASKSYVRKYGGGAPQIFIVPIVDPSGAKATYTITVTGPATAAGNIPLDVGGMKVPVGVSSGDSANTIAANIKKAIARQAANFAAVATVSGAVVTLTMVNAGVNGNSFKATCGNKVPAGVTVVIAAGTAGSGVADASPALDNLNDKVYDTIALGNHASADLDDLAEHIGVVNAPGVKRFCKAVIANVGNLSSGVTLATHANQKEIVVVNAQGCPRLPGEIAAQIAATIESEPKTKLSFNSVELDLEAPDASFIPDSGSGSTVETALASGLCILGSNDDNTKMRIIRLVTTCASFNSAPFYDTLDISTVRGLFFVATQIDIRWKRDFPRANREERTQKAVYSSTYDVLKDCEAIGVLHNVDAHKDEIIVDPDAVNLGRYNVAIPNTIVPNLHQIVGVNTLILE